MAAFVPSKRSCWTPFTQTAPWRPLPSCQPATTSPSKSTALRRLDSPATVEPTSKVPTPSFHWVAWASPAVTQPSPTTDSPLPEMFQPELISVPDEPPMPLKGVQVLAATS